MGAALANAVQATDGSEAVYDAARRVLTHSFAAMNSGMSGSLLLAVFSLGFVAVLAAAIPANRSARVDPVIALRNE